MNAMTVLSLTTIFLSGYTTSASSQQKAAPACPGHTTVAIEACMSADLEREEARLQQAITRARASVDPSARASVDSANVAWERFRDAQCMSVYKAFTGGSAGGMALLSCKIDLTKERRRAMRTMYEMH